MENKKDDLVYQWITNMVHRWAKEVEEDVKNRLDYEKTMKKFYAEETNSATQN